MSCALFLPPLIFIGGCHGQQRRFQQLILIEPTLGASEEQSHDKVEAVEPMGLIGWPAWGANHPSFLGLAVLEAQMSKQAAMPCPKSVKLLWWAYGSLSLRLIGREDIALD